MIVRRTARLPGLLLALIGAAPAMAQHGPPPPRPDIKPGQPTAWTRLLIEAIETAHGAAALREHAMVEVELTFTAVSHPPFEGVIRFDTDPVSRRVRLDRSDGVTLLHDGERCWMTAPFTPPTSTPDPAGIKGDDDGESGGPDDEARGAAIFQLKALPRLVAMPFRLRDPKVRLIPSGFLRVGDEAYHAVSMTFPENDDWLGVFAHRLRDRVMMISYFIRTPATIEPRVGLPPAYVIAFSDFEEAEGVTLARTWTIRRWHRADGPVGEPLGEAKIGSVRLGPLDEAIFKPPTAEAAPGRTVIELTPKPKHEKLEEKEEDAPANAP